MLIFASGLVCIIHWMYYHKIDKISLISFFVISFFGSLTLVFHNSQFIKWKITIIYIFLSIALLVSQFWTKKTIMQKLLEKDINIPDIYWKKINFSWSLFFLFCSFLNIYIAFWLSEKNWVNFKVFGLMFLTFLAVLITGVYIHTKTKKK